MSSATENGRISLHDNLQHKWFSNALVTLAKHKDSLDSYTLRLWTDLDAGYSMVGRDMTITRRQMNHIKTVAAELESGRG